MDKVNRRGFFPVKKTLEDLRISRLNVGLSHGIGSRVTIWRVGSLVVAVRVWNRVVVCVVEQVGKQVRKKKKDG